MLKVGMIGAGTITQRLIEAFNKNKDSQVVAIADLNEALAKEKAATCGIADYYTDYRKIIEDDNIDAVCIATPTFTHCSIVVEALKAGKQVLCEKPPTLNVEEATLAVETAQETGNLLMWELPIRFRQEVQFLKQYIDSGLMGQILSAEAYRVSRYNAIGGWFADKDKSGGGALIDQAIHQIDTVMYLMGYPKVKSVLGFSTDVNNSLAGKIKGKNALWISSDKNNYDRTIESMASGYVTFENGASLYIKSGNITFSVKDGIYFDLIGEKAGARFENNELTLLTNVQDYMMESKPDISNKENLAENAVNHFVDCCVNHTKCICEDWQAIELMKIIEGIYKSAKIGQPITY